MIWFGTPLRHCSDLELSSNQFTGTVPDSLSNTTNLSIFLASANRFIGTLPTWLSLLQKLTYVLLTLKPGLLLLCRAWGHMDCARLYLFGTGRSLNFTSNQFTGTVPSVLSALFPASSATWSLNCITNCVNQYPNCSMPERQALVDLYSSTFGPGWTTNTNWLTKTNPCSWYGVTCTTASSGAVVYVPT